MANYSGPLLEGQRCLNFCNKASSQWRPLLHSGTKSSFREAFADVSRLMTVRSAHSLGVFSNGDDIG